MTERGSGPERTRPTAGRAATTRRRSAVAVTWATIAVFLAVFTGMALQLRTGHDPAIGAGTRAATTTTTVAPRRVLVRRIVEKRVVVHVVPATSQAGPAPASTPAPAPSTVVTSSPPPAAVPAPAPVAAPVTRSS